MDDLISNPIAQGSVIGVLLAMIGYVLKWFMNHTSKTSGKQTEALVNLGKQHEGMIKVLERMNGDEE